MPEVKFATSRFHARAAEVLRLRETGMTPTQIADEWGVSRARIYQLEQRGLSFREYATTLNREHNHGSLSDAIGADLEDKDWPTTVREMLKLGRPYLARVFHAIVDYTDTPAPQMTSKDALMAYGEDYLKSVLQVIVAPPERVP